MRRDADCGASETSFCRKYSRCDWLSAREKRHCPISFRYQKEGTPLPLNCDETARDLEVPHPSADQRPLKTSDHAVDRFPYQRPHTIPTADPHVSPKFSISKTYGSKYNGTYGRFNPQGCRKRAAPRQAFCVYFATLTDLPYSKGCWKGARLGTRSNQCALGDLFIVLLQPD